VVYFNGGRESPDPDKSEGEKRGGGDPRRPTELDLQKEGGGFKPRRESRGGTARGWLCFTKGEGGPPARAGGGKKS